MVDELPLIFSISNTRPLYPAYFTYDISEIIAFIAELVNLPKSFPPPTVIQGPPPFGPKSFVQHYVDGDVS